METISALEAIHQLEEMGYRIELTNFGQDLVVKVGKTTWDVIFTVDGQVEVNEINILRKDLTNPALIKLKESV